MAVEDKIPDGVLSDLDDDNTSQSFHAHESLKGKKIILLAVPGGFTPICSVKHVPSLIEHAQEIESKGILDIIVISVNDPCVMKAWEKTFPGNEHLKFLANGSMNFTKALGMELDLSDHGMGLTRYSLLINDLVVEVANIEEGGSFEPGQ